jgi:putative glutathione S-transferase
LEDIVTLINAGNTDLTAEGWRFDPGNDTLNGFKTSKELYLRADPNYENRYTVPILWDQKLQTIGFSKAA